MNYPSNHGECPFPCQRHSHGFKCIRRHILVNMYTLLNSWNTVNSLDLPEFSKSKLWEDIDRLLNENFKTSCQENHMVILIFFHDYIFLQELMAFWEQVLECLYGYFKVLFYILSVYIITQVLLFELYTWFHIAFYFSQTERAFITFLQALAA